MLRRGLAVVVLALGLVAAGAATPAQAYDEGTIVALANEARASQGLGGLVHNASLDAVARGWADQLSVSGALSHNPSVGQQIPGGWRSWGENVASGYTTGAAVHDGWMNSAGHRANILGSFTDIGVALIRAGGTTWAVEVFATYPGSGLPAPAPPAPQPAAPAPQPAAPAAPPAPAADPVPAAPAVIVPAAPAPTTPAAAAVPSGTPSSAASTSPPSPTASVVARAADGEAAAYATPADNTPWWPGIAALVLVGAVSAVLIVLRVRRGV